MVVAEAPHARYCLACMSAGPALVWRNDDDGKRSGVSAGLGARPAIGSGTHE